MNKENLQKEILRILKNTGDDKVLTNQFGNEVLHRAINDVATSESTEGRTEIRSPQDLAQKLLAACMKESV